MARRLGHSNRQRERAIQHALQVRIANRIERSVRSEIAGAMRDAAKSIAQGGDIGPSVRSHNERLATVIASAWDQTARLIGGRLLNAAKCAHGNQWVRKRAPDDVFGVGVNTFIRQLTGTKVVEISRTTEAQIRTIIRRGIDEGMGTDAIARLIRSETPIRAALRAHVIARTETHGAAGFGSHFAAEATGLPLKKDWISARDDRTRDGEFDHVSADGETVGMNEPFTRTGEPLMYPGDPSGSPGNIILCRCGSGYLFEE